MAEIVIKIDDELLNQVKYFCEVYLEPNAHTMSYDLMRSVQNGTLLPKGHGRLIDADKTISKICGSSCGCHLEECGNDNPCYLVARISSASTIVKADKAESEMRDACSD